DDHIKGRDQRRFQFRLHREIDFAHRGWHGRCSARQHLDDRGQVDWRLQKRSEAWRHHDAWRHEDEHQGHAKAEGADSEAAGEVTRRQIYTGTLTAALNPPIGLSPSVMSPPCERAMSRAMASPRPVPPSSWLRASSSRRNGLNTSSRILRAMPGPSSSTVTVR